MPRLSVLGSANGPGFFKGEMMQQAELFNDGKSAVLSPCRKYRYSLFRWWDKSKPYVMFIGLNPSTADETKDDATIRRCIQFAKDWGFGGLCMANLFAFRATVRADMKKYSYPTGFQNDEWLLILAKDAALIVAAWGTDGNHLGREKRVKDMMPPMKCLGKTLGGHPKHPLYLRKDTELIQL